MSLRWFKLAVSASCLVALLWWTDAGSVLTRLQSVDVVWVSLAVVALTLATLSMARRWQIVARAFDIKLSYAVALREYYLAQLVNAVVPGGVAGDVARTLRTRHAADLPRAAQSVMAERLLGQMAILGLMFVGFSVAILVPGGLDWAALGWIVLAALSGGCAATWGLSRGDTATGRFIRTTLTLLRRPEPLSHGVITTACLIFGFYACARATGTIIPAAGWATLIPLVLCAMLIPLSIGGWGLREGAAAALFPIVGAPASAGVATGITYGLVMLIAVLPAGLLLLSRTVFENLSLKGKPNVP